MEKKMEATIMGWPGISGVGFNVLDPPHLH